MARTPDPRIANLDTELSLPRKNGELVFEAPWEARAFGMAVALNDAGIYPWRHFSQGLAAETAAAEGQENPASYYERWLETLAHQAMAHGLLTAEELEARSAECTPGGDAAGHDHHGEVHH